VEYIDFGQTGLKVSRLAIGTGTNGFGGRSEQTALGVEGLANLLREAYDHGVTFWDAADGYGSHQHLARALQGVPRDKVVVATKTTSRNGQQVTQDVERYLRELGTDVIDVVLLHFITEARWTRRFSGAMDALSRAKQQGKVRAVGVSCHNFGAFRAAAESDWVDVVLARINHAGVSMDASPDRVVPVIERMYASGRAVYGMKVLGRGQLARSAADVRKAIQYVLGLGTVHAITIGTTRHEHLHQNLALVEELAPQHPFQHPS
jgi:aryl-alcohol dehydrogenase-like predicted oxidoreductase